MAMRPIKSAFIHSVSHDEPSKTLIVVFKRGDLYTYDGVSAELFDQMMASERPSAFFLANIRDAFTATKIRVPTPPAPAQQLTA